MGEAFITRRGSSKPKPPTGYTFLQLIASSMTWAAPEAGWYKIYCVGKSGNGGAGGQSAILCAGGGGGSGGNSGGVAISQLFLRASQSIAITVNNSITSFGGYLSASGGANGVVGIAGQAQPGAGVLPPVEIGQAYGGNLLNSTGIQGGYSGRGAIRYAPSAGGQSVGNNSGGNGFDDPNSSATYCAGGGGGAGADYNNLGIYQGATNLAGGNGRVLYSGQSGIGISAPQAITSPPRFEGSGGGGGGGSGTNSDNASESQWPGAGGLGSPGGVIIEKGMV